MAKKEKKISVNAFEAIAKERFVNIVTEQWFDVEVTIKRILPITESIQFINDVVDACFRENGEYIPELRDFMERVCVLTYYANFTMPSSLEKQYELVYGTDAYHFVMEHIDPDHYYSIIYAINEKLDHMLDADVMHTRAKLAELFSAYDSMTDKFADVFAGISAGSIKSLVDAIGERGIDENKVVSAYVEQMKSSAK